MPDRDAWEVRLPHSSLDLRPQGCFALLHSSFKINNNNTKETTIFEVEETNSSPSITLIVFSFPDCDYPTTPATTSSTQCRKIQTCMGSGRPKSKRKRWPSPDL
jgi:hypothetical protein